jgi:hypothetical protein
VQSDREQTRRHARRAMEHGIGQPKPYFSLVYHA